MLARLKKIGRLVLGGLLIFCGILGFFLPFAPGLLLVLAGIYLIDGKWGKKIRDKIHAWKRKLFRKKKD